MNKITMQTKPEAIQTPIATKASKDVKGFTQIMNSTILDNRLSAVQFRVLSVLLYHKGQNKVAWPSIRTIQRESGLGKNAVLRAINRLEQLNYVQIERGELGKNSKYGFDGVVLQRNQGGSLKEPGGSLKEPGGSLKEPGGSLKEPGVVSQGDHNNKHIRILNKQDSGIIPKKHTHEEQGIFSLSGSGQDQKTPTEEYCKRHYPFLWQDYLNHCKRSSIPFGDYYRLQTGNEVFQ